MAGLEQHFLSLFKLRHVKSTCIVNVLVQRTLALPQSITNDTDQEQLRNADLHVLAYIWMKQILMSVKSVAVFPFIIPLFKIVRHT